MLANADQQLAILDKPAPHRPIRVIFQRVQTLTAQYRFQASKTAAETKSVIIVSVEQQLATPDKLAPHRPIRVIIRNVPTSWEANLLSVSKKITMISTISALS